MKKVTTLDNNLEKDNDDLTSESSDEDLNSELEPDEYIFSSDEEDVKS